MKRNPIPTFSLAAFESIRETIGKMPTETGGMICGDSRTDLITYFYFDEKAKCSAGAYSPDTVTLNGLLKKLNAEGLEMMGFPHSHPVGFDSPSSGDELYAKRIFAANPKLRHLLIPIIDSVATGRPFQMRVFVATPCDGEVEIQRVPLRIAETETREPASATLAMAAAAEELSSPEFWRLNPEAPVTPRKNYFPPRAKIDRELFSRVVDAGDLELLVQSRQIRVGVGSSIRSLEDSARAGIGQFVVIDNGRVERCNLATQGYFLDDIGKPKVEVAANRLRAINPHVAVQTVFGSFLDIPDTEFKRLAFDPFYDVATGATAESPRQVLLVGATDDFHCQCRVNALALNLGLRSLCAQHYLTGLASEITFTHPETVRACHRCILSSRYKAYLKDGYKNTVGSSGSPISSAAMLNALTVNLALAILHYGTGHPRWGKLLTRIGDRNLIQIRNHPDAEELLGLKNFSQAFSGVTSDQILFGETIWRRQLPEHPRTGHARPCPGCGGTGDLNLCLGTIADTRVIAP